MEKEKKIKILFWILNIFVIIILIWSLINYKFLRTEVSEFVQIGGLSAMILLVILLEGAPVFVGSSVVVASILTMGFLNPAIIFMIFIASAIIGNILYFSIGYFSGKKILNYFDKKHIKKYEELFKKYGMAAMIIMAVSPLPYLPTIAGIFHVTSAPFITGTLVVRMVRHTVTFLFWFFMIFGF